MARLTSRLYFWYATRACTSTFQEALYLGTKVFRGWVATRYPSLSYFYMELKT